MDEWKSGLSVCLPVWNVRMNRCGWTGADEPVRMNRCGWTGADESAVLPFHSLSIFPSPPFILSFSFCLCIFLYLFFLFVWMFSPSAVDPSVISIRHDIHHRGAGFFRSEQLNQEFDCAASRAPKSTKEKRIIHFNQFNQEKTNRIPERPLRNTHKRERNWKYLRGN